MIVPKMGHVLVSNQSVWNRNVSPTCSRDILLELAMERVLAIGRSVQKGSNLLGNPSDCEVSGTQGRCVKKREVGKRGGKQASGQAHNGRGMGLGRHLCTILIVTRGR